MIEIVASSNLEASTRDRVDRIRRVAFEEAARLAVTTIARKTRTALVRGAVGISTVKRRLISANLRVRNTSVNAASGEVSSRISFRRVTYSLREFDPVFVANGIAVQIIKGAPPVLFRGAFRGVGRGGNVQAFQRTTTSRRDPRSRRGKRRRVQSGKYRGKAYYSQLPIRRLTYGLWPIWDRVRPNAVQFVERSRAREYESALAKRLAFNGLS